jgi:hypothetical protein
MTDKTHNPAPAPSFSITEANGQRVVKHLPTGATYSLSDPTSSTELRNAIRKLKLLVNSVETTQ